MLRKDDEKYAKAAAAKQTARHGIVLRAAVVGFSLVLLFLFLQSQRSSPHSASSKLKKPRMKLGDDATHEMLTKEQVLPGKKVIAAVALPSLKELDKIVADLDTKVREIKDRVDIFETNHEAQTAAKELQEATRQVLHRRFGPDDVYPYRVVVDLEFQNTISDFAQHGSSGSFTIELAPSSLQPHSIHTFLEIARQWHGGAFHRIAGHVLQVMVKTHTIPHLAFQEYSSAYPHKERTVGYAGRPSGPAWYVSIEDNTRNHGPGSQQDHNPYEADSCFGTVVKGYEEHVLRIKKVDGMGFLGDAKKHVLIKTMTIHVASKAGKYAAWHDMENEALS
ncbi:hypothetical protein MHU86_13734 [Fragilaria crotonensis]|nr:hypothetical protein MHU86_13734 [Fragilaria crotonensis]